MADEIEPRAILDSLGVRDATVIARLSGGSRTVAYRVETPREAYALRVFRAGADETRWCEVAAMRAAEAGGVPVPHVVSVGSWQAHPAVLLSWCTGHTVFDELSVRPWQAYRLGVLVGRTLAVIHQVSAPTVLREQRDSWVDWAGPDDGPLRQRLWELSRTEDDAALLHLDYHWKNIMTDGTRITGVLDWENARAGDPRADLARTVSILLVDTRGPHSPSSAEQRMRLALARGCLGGYAGVAGVPSEHATRPRFQARRHRTGAHPRLDRRAETPRGPPGRPIARRSSPGVSSRAHRSMTSWYRHLLAASRGRSSS